jgi:ferric-dicitrate binding protein FerR (iron transport regulator)
MTSKFEVQQGDRLDVPAGSALAARRADGLSVRVAGPAYLVWDSAERMQLDRGRVYVDVGPGQDTGRAAFEVRTPLARIEHVGTRFVADASPARVRVAVRDGRVRMTSANGDALGLEGGQAAEAAVNGQITWVTPPVRTDWEWVDALAPPCGIDGRSLFDVLTDLAREADLQLVFASPEIERRARDLTLHGPALELPPRTAIDAVLATTDLDADLAGTRVVLRDRMTGT